MKIPINAFGKDIVAEWHSDDYRQFANRKGCYDLRSFPYLEQEDSRALRNNFPVRLTEVWIHDANQHPTPPEGTGNLVVISWSRHSHADQERCYGKVSRQNALCEQIIRSELYSGSDWFALPCFAKPEASGFRVVCATLEDGNFLFLSAATGEWRQVPIKAHEYFLAQDHAGRFEKIETGQKMIASRVVSLANNGSITDQSLNAKLLDDLVMLTRQQREELGDILALKGITGAAKITTLTNYAFGKLNVEEAAKALGYKGTKEAKERRFHRLKVRIPAPYRLPFEGTQEERKARAAKHGAEALKKVAADLVAAELRRRASSDASEPENENDPTAPEFYPESRKTPVRKSDY